MRHTLLSVVAALSLASSARAAPPSSGPQPVTVENTPSVNVANTPSVTVANVPGVTVTNIPAVTVTNVPGVTVTNVPGVTVTNSPTVQLAQGSTIVIGNAAGSPVPVRNVESEGKGAFQATVSLDWFGTAGIGVSIPAGKRLVVDFIALTGAAQTAGAGIQPYVLIFTTLTGGPAIPFTLQVPQSPIAPGQYDLAQPLKLYADSLFVSLAFAEFAPTFLVMTASIAGHLVDP